MFLSLSVSLSPSEFDSTSKLTPSVHDPSPPIPSSPCTLSSHPSSNPAPGAWQSRRISYILSTLCAQKKKECGEGGSNRTRDPTTSFSSHQRDQRLSIPPVFQSSTLHSSLHFLHPSNPLRTERERERNREDTGENGIEPWDRRWVLSRNMTGSGMTTGGKKV